MNISKTLFFTLIGFPIICTAANIEDVYVQNKGRMLGFSETVLQAKGSITFTGQSSKYLIDLNGRKATVDFSSEKNIRAEMSAFYPDHIVIQITFLNVKPNTLAFIDNNLIAAIDKNGNSTTPKFPISEPGNHIVQLKSTIKTVDSTILNVHSSAFVRSYLVK